MIVFAYVTLYVFCTLLLVAVVLQDRRRGAAPEAPPASEPRRPRSPTLVFRTHV